MGYITQIRERELSCLVIYSDRKYVSYINNVVDQIKDALEKESNFKVNKLGAEIASGEDYLNKLEELVDNCVLGVILLDGLRPNVLFEFGFLLGRQKPFIILQSKDALINVKGLYVEEKYSGLSSNQFSRLKEPKLDVRYNLSDFAGKHLSIYDWGAEKTDSVHTVSVLKRELEKIKDQIHEETKKIKTKHIQGDVLQEILDPLNRIIGFYIAATIDKDATKIDVKELKKAHEDVVNISKQHASRLPADVYNMIAAIYVAKANAMWQNNIKASLSYAQSAGEVYENILKVISVQNDAVEYGITQKKLGDIRYVLSQHYEGREERISSATESIQAYNESLRVYRLEKYPEEYAMVQNNLGNANHWLAEEIDEGHNYEKAIQAYNESLRVYRLEKYPEEYAMVQNNLGVSYYTLAKIEDHIKNHKESINAFDEALKVYTSEKFPREYDMTKANLKEAALAIKYD